MELSKLLSNVGVKMTTAKPSLEIEGIAADSRKIDKGWLFIALKGSNSDGNDYIAEAVKKGAAAVVCDREPPKAMPPIPFIEVGDTREAYAKIAANYFGNPEKKLKFIGVSGTNGKTTTAHMIHHIMSANGIETGLTGTIGNIIGGVREEAGMTTPDPLEFFGLLKRMAESGAKAVVSEVSAHAVYYKKISPIEAEAAIYTNCTQDHLDFFKSMESYSGVKKSYFKKPFAKKVIVNADDALGGEIISGSDAEVISYGIENPSDVFAVNVGLSVEGSAFYVNVFDDVSYVWLPLPGLFNVYNALAALTAASLIGIPLSDAAESLGGLPEIPGRFNIIEAEKCHFILDYAHSPDGLKKILTSARSIAEGRLISVFGCGGDRDKSKRPIMGEISADTADYTVITSDNPRFENPEDIIREIEDGTKKRSKAYECITDRKEAIKRAYETAKKGDVIVVAGKGAEPYLDVKGEKLKYSDRGAIEDIINGRI